MRRIGVSFLLAGFAVAVCSTTSHAEDWGNIKGQIVWSGKVAPAAKEIKPNKDEQHCLSKGALLSNEILVDKDTLGVANVMIWLAPFDKGGKIPINPKLKAVPQDKVIIDQPCCMFEPRITMMREGQTLVIKNSAPVPHNSRVSGNPEINGTKNPNIPPGGSVEFGGETKLKAEPKPLLLACDIHGWMGGRIGVFDHPYFALTKKDGTFEIKDAPAGKFRIYIQHEAVGWLHKVGAGEKLSGGQVIEIKAGETLDLGKIEMKSE
jgi:hypothetical protein